MGEPVLSGFYGRTMSGSGWRCGRRDLDCWMPLSPQTCPLGSLTAQRCANLHCLLAHFARLKTDAERLIAVLGRQVLHARLPFAVLAALALGCRSAGRSLRIGSALQCQYEEYGLADKTHTKRNRAT